jgi:hypothetical protein
MTTKTKTFDGILVELEIDSEGSQGWASYGNYSASIEALYQQGVLCSDDDKEKRVSPQTRERIYSWAVANGY